MNKRVIARLPSRRLAPTVVQASADGLHIRQDGTERLLPWAEIDRVTAAASGQMVGDRQMLVIGAESGETVTVSEAEPIWRSLADSLHLYLPGSARAAMWQLELAGGAVRVEVYRR